MDKGTILTAKRLNADHTTAVASQMGPVVGHALYLQYMLNSASMFLLLRAHLLSEISYHVAKAAGWYAYIAGSTAFAMSGSLAHGVWETSVVRHLRQRLFDELAAFILGAGQTLIVVVFWPGWWLLAGSAWSIWFVWGGR